MNENKKIILIAVTGGSPQVITETLYGIIKKDLPWPDQIDILTTGFGKQNAIKALLNKKYDSKTIIQQLCDEYEKPVPVLTEETIYTIKNEHDEELEDARTVEEQEILADFIVNHVANRSKNPDVQIHASIAGGRKTMTFYLGYAMSLFSRLGDRLSHVLVDKKFENNPDFYYPTIEDNEIPVYDRGIVTEQKLNTKEAVVELAEIPFIRQRDSLKKSIKSFENEPYRDLVYYQNAVNHLSSIKVEFNRIRRCITIADKEIDFQDNMLEFAFYAMIATHVKEHKGSLIKISKNDYSRSLTDLFMLELELCGDETEPNPCFMVDNGSLTVDIDKFKATFQHRAEELSDEDFISFARHKKEGKGEDAILIENDIATTYLELEFGMTYAFFNDRLNKLKKKLLIYFPSDFVHCLVPSQVYDSDEYNNKQFVKRDYSTKGQQKTPYGLWLDEENISFK